MMCLVTLKVEKDPNHDPKNKKEGPCPVSPTGERCTDVTGQHHTVLFHGTVEQARIEYQYDHITRIEEV